MPIFDYGAFEAAELRRDPYDHVVVPKFVRPEAIEAINRDYPVLDDPGSYPLDDLECGPAFEAFAVELHSAEFRAAFERKFGIDLTDHPIMATVREQCQETDGHIHTDSKTKIITILFYFNPEWKDPGGRLRILRSPDDLGDYAAEVPPAGGTLVAFRPCRHSFHGHLPFSGQRRMVQMHWVDPKRIDRNREKRKSFKWRVKKALRLG